MLATYGVGAGYDDAETPWRCCWGSDRVGAVTGVVGAAGGLGGFFPPLVMGAVKSATGGYALGFALMALVAVACLVVLRTINRVPASATAPA